MKENPDFPHYSTRGVTTQSWRPGDVKENHPLAFVMTVKQLRETFER
jgi:hypothetical protein